MKPFVLVVDMIHDFVYGKFKNDRAINIIPGIKKLLDVAREKKIPIIYLKDSHEKGDPEENLWGEHAMKDSKGSEIVDELKPKPDDYVILKRTYSGFYKTDLDLLLKKLEVNTAFVVGVSTDICVQNNVGELFYRGFNIYVLKDCTASISEENHESALYYMKNIFNAKIISLDEAIKLLEEV